MKKFEWIGVSVIALLAATPAFAHPHVWITTRAELDYGPDGTLRAVRHAWTFDPTYSAFAPEAFTTGTHLPMSSAMIFAKAAGVVAGARSKPCGASFSRTSGVARMRLIWLLTRPRSSVFGET